jgi:hypothetical protein
MKPTTYALIAALTLGVAPTVSVTAQQDTDHQAARIATRHHLNTAPVLLAPVMVDVSAPARASAVNRPINHTPVRLDPVRIVASRNGAGTATQSGKAVKTPQHSNDQMQIHVIIAELRVAQILQ